jgi:transcriptional regulator with XRE-family HTH domain
MSNGLLLTFRAVFDIGHNMITAAELKAARKAIGETQEQFAARFGISRTTYVNWENLGTPDNGPGPELIRRVLAEVGQYPTEAAE